MSETDFCLTMALLWLVGLEAVVIFVLFYSLCEMDKEMTKITNKLK